MKFLVLGCNGMVGHMVSFYLKEQGHDVLGFARSQSKYVPSVLGDAESPDDIRKVITEGNFDSVINGIGLLNRTAEENKSRAIYLNSYLPHYLAEITSGTKTQIIHLSTDCVFSGERGGYTEEDLPDGRTFYDRSKAMGELEDNKNVTLRTSVVGPDINPEGIGLMNWFMRQEGEINGFTKMIWTGQTTLQLARTMEMAAKERICGLYNMVPNTSITKFELLKLFNHYLRNDSLVIHPADGIIADKSLKRTRFDFDCPVPDYETMVREAAEWMKAHKTMYPHYHL